MMLSNFHFKEIVVKPISPNFGAFIDEIDPSKLDSHSVCSELKQALWLYKVLFIRNKSFSPSFFVKLGSVFGALEKRPQFEHIDGFPQIQKLCSLNPEKTGANEWHTDLSYRKKPNLVTLLRAKKLPTHGGDTIWADTRAAFKALSKPLKSLFFELRGVHDLSNDYGSRSCTNSLRLISYPPTTHPVVISHPYSKEHSIFVNRLWTVKLLKGDSEFNDKILTMIFDWIEKPEFTFRFQWKENSIAIWDNFSSQHYAVHDYGNEYREMHRILSCPTTPESVKIY